MILIQLLRYVGSELVLTKMADRNSNLVTNKDVEDYIVPESEKHLVNRTNQFSRLQKLTEQQRLEVLDLIDKKELTFEQIGKLYNVTKGAISAIKRSKIKFGK